MKSLCISICLIAASLFCYSQQALPYHTSFETTADTTGWQQYRLGAEALPFSQWYYFNGHLNHDYPVTGLGLTDDWMVSPAFNFSNGGTIDSLRFRGEGFGVPMNQDTVALYLLNGSKNPDSSSNKVLLKLFSDSSYMNDNIWKGHYAINIPQMQGTSYLAFRYQTESNWLDVSLDDILITGNPVGVEENPVESPNMIYPNPVRNRFNCKIGCENIAVYEMNGQLVKHCSGKQFCDVSELGQGMYILQIESPERIFYKKLVVAR